MTAPLRPMNLSEILDRTFHIYRSRFLLYLGIAAFPALTIAALRIVSYLLGTFGPERIVDLSHDYGEEDKRTAR